MDFVAFYDKPFIKFERILETYLAYAPLGIRSFIKAMPLWIKQKLWMKELIRKELILRERLFFLNIMNLMLHRHFSLLPFKKPPFLPWMVLVSGQLRAMVSGRTMRCVFWQKFTFPILLGLLYSAFTYYTGFKVNSGEYKVMGLAPYGEPNTRI